MNRDGHKGVAFFVGPEVEHTPANSKKTLFVVGKQDIKEILQMAEKHKTPHVFMGANQSVDISDAAYLDKSITELLDRGYWVTLDYPAAIHGNMLELLNAGIWQSRLFVPLISVRIPSIESSSPNLTIKIDDVDFNSTNPGVWCHHFHELMDSNRFTSWQEYESDEVVGPEVASPVVETKTPVTPAPVAADEVKPEDMNPVDLGLDSVPTTALKPEVDDSLTRSITATALDAAEAYAEGATEDALGKEASKKPVKKVKAA
jgi:hypothetical protein